MEIILHEFMEITFMNKVSKIFLKIRLRPIRVLCFHQTSESLIPNIYAEPDWIATEELKQKIEDIISEGYTFISLDAAYKHICTDFFRIRKYAVLTADDGFKCQLELLPWLKERNIPLTIFVTADNLNGITCGPQILEYFGISDKNAEAKLAHHLYIDKATFDHTVDDFLTFGIHGDTHVDSTKYSGNSFEIAVQRCVNTIGKHDKYIPFFAYPFGTHSDYTDAVLYDNNCVPVYIDGLKNYNDTRCIHRELIK